LYNNSLSSLPKEIGNLLNLVELDLNSNKLSSLPKELGTLINLQKLSLNENRISSFPSEMGNLINLEQLELSNNRFEVLPNEILNFENLTILHLNKNRLTSLPDDIEKLLSLNQLQICNNALKSLPLSIKKITKLEYLMIEECPNLNIPAKIVETQNAQKILEYLFKPTLLQKLLRTPQHSVQKSDQPKLLHIPQRSVQKSEQPKQPRKIFISYCWKNSKQALQLRQVQSYNGQADPRDIAKQVEQIMEEKCWIDIDVANGGHALFSAIQIGIDQSEVVVACISDQYIKSDTCEDELTYARKVCKKPIIPVIVGDGSDWQHSWAGLMLAKELYIDFKDHTKFETNMNLLIERLRKILSK